MIVLRKKTLKGGEGGRRWHEKLVIINLHFVTITGAIKYCHIFTFIHQQLILLLLNVACAKSVHPCNVLWLPELNQLSFYHLWMNVRGVDIHNTAYTTTHAFKLIHEMSVHSLMLTKFFKLFKFWYIDKFCL